MKHDHTARTTQEEPHGKPSLFHDLPRWWWISAVTIMALAAGVRALLWTRFPIFLTNDSPDYLGGAEFIASSLDFTSRQLRDWRPPGYPVFLAVLHWMSLWNSMAVVAAQKLVGLSTVLLGFVTGRALGCRVGALVLGAFLGLHPVYLLFEHMAMSETLFIQLIWIFTTLAILAIGRAPGRVQGLLLGGTLGLCILTRAPGLFFCAPVLAGVALYAFLRAPGPSPRVHARRFAIGTAIGLLLVIGPWSYRNYVMFGTLSPFTNNAQRSMLAYMYVLKVVDPNLPEARSARETSDKPREAAGELVRQLGDGADAEDRAATLIRDQIGAHKKLYAKQVVLSAANFTGLYSSLAPGARDISYWFRRFVGDVGMMKGHNHSLLRRTRTFVYVETAGPGFLLDSWVGIGRFFLHRFRPLLSATFGLFTLAFCVSAGPRFEGRESAILLILVVGFTAVIVGHSLLLAGMQRYAVPWEGIQMLGIVGISAHFGSRRLARRRRHA